MNNISTGYNYTRCVYKHYDDNKYNSR